MSQGYYAGIGARRTPPDILDLMEELARALARDGWRLRSGHADGADQAFERGAAGHADIFLPWPGFNRRPKPTGRVHQTPADWAYARAAEHHPAWHQLREPVRAMMARNVHQVLGWAGEPPSVFVVCWTPDGATTAEETTQRTGGTGQAIRLAAHHGIPVLNLARQEHRARAEQHIR